MKYLYINTTSPLDLPKEPLPYRRDDGLIILKKIETTQINEGKENDILLAKLINKFGIDYFDYIEIVYLNDIELFSSFLLCKKLSSIKFYGEENKYFSLFRKVEKKDGYTLLIK